jgi:hypothetical protein
LVKKIIILKNATAYTWDWYCHLVFDRASSDMNLQHGSKNYIFYILGTSARHHMNSGLLAIVALLSNFLGHLPLALLANYLGLLPVALLANYLGLLPFITSNQAFWPYVAHLAGSSGLLPGITSNIQNSLLTSANFPSSSGKALTSLKLDPPMDPGV